MEWTHKLQSPLHLLFISEDVQSYKGCLDRSVSSIQLSFYFIAVTKAVGVRDSHMRPLSRFECNDVTQYQIISPNFFIILGENMLVYHKSISSIHTQYLSLTDASVKPHFNSFTDSLTTQIFNNLWKTETTMNNVF